MNTKEYRNYKRMTKMTVRFLEKDDIYTKLTPMTETSATTTSSSSLAATTPTFTLTSTPIIQSTPTPPTTTFSTISQDPPDKLQKFSNNLPTTKNEFSPTREALIAKSQEFLQANTSKSEIGKYVNWGSTHTALAALAWCCIGDLMAFCDKYEYRTLNRNDPQMHNRIVTEVKTLLGGQAPFDIRKRFPCDIRSPENLWVCIGRCIGVEYHLNRILSIFRRPMDKLSADKQRIVRHDFHLAINELRLDISARISEVRLYDRPVFERDFHLEWQDDSAAE